LHAGIEWNGDELRDCIRHGGRDDTARAWDRGRASGATSNPVAIALRPHSLADRHPEKQRAVGSGQLAVVCRQLFSVDAGFCIFQTLISRTAHCPCQANGFATV
jgi:hypothetical protein